LAFILGAMTSLCILEALDRRLSRSASADRRRASRDNASSIVHDEDDEDDDDDEDAPWIDDRARR
jgi:hypothetical protein